MFILSGVSRSSQHYLPNLSVRIEDSTAEEILQHVDEGISLGVVLEVGFEHVLHVDRISGDDPMAHPQATVGDGVRRVVSEELSRPVEETVTILEEL